MASSLDSPFPLIQTDRPILRVFDPSRPSDYEAVLSIYDCPYALRTIGNPGLYTRHGADTRCAKFHPRPPNFPTSKPFPSHPWHLIYLRSNPSVLVGTTSLFHRHPLPSPDLGYFIHEEFTNQGYATEAGKAALKWWTEEMGVKDIWAGTFDTNYVSQRVARKIGFVDGGVIRLVMSDELTREGRAFVPEGMETMLDGLTIDVRQK
ncbi:hypothetical protein H2200_005174 [Cladophialophora chaetospira]|uniref:N-acetyltransferase domain-containing protein n=1 Tax=Cladophialophora chaetospira TaxID=386627 RepID=A0AA39CJC3_9EURO|nr:hypothetical protein H2200_005174 [Cladophialophora chaetospira]